jgi:two-component system nitrate/nitrite response regulator NarL
MQRVLIAEEQGLFRSALRVSLDNETGLRVVAETANAADTLAQCSRARPHLVLLADNLAESGSTPATCADLLRLDPAPVVLVLTASDDEELLLSVLDAGAIGYVTRDSRLTDLVNSVHAALRGEACVPRRMLGGLLKELINRRRAVQATTDRFSRLSTREKQVLAELVQGLEGDVIAARLFISPQTVRTHIQNVLAKLEVHSRLEAANLAREHGLVSERRENPA